MTELSARQLNRATLARQLLLRREPVDVVEAVRRVVALQAQEPASPYLALWNRIDGFDPDELDAAFADRSIVKATLMRITLHAVAAEDHPPFHAAMLPNLRASRLNDRRYTGTGLTVADADAVLPGLVEFAAEPRTKADIEAFVSDHLGEPADPQLWWALRTFAPLVHAPTDATWSFGTRPSFQAAPTEPRDGPADASLPHLVRRYLEGFGPATVADISQFALQRRGEVRDALRTVGDLVTFTGPDGAELFDVPGAVIPDEDTPAPPRLLGMWDSVLLAYADRTRVVSDELRRIVIRRNGDVLPTLLVDGHVAGVWRSTGAGIEVRAFTSLRDEDRDALAGEARELTTMLADRDPAVYSRYGRWWDQLPPGEDGLLPA